MSAAERAQAQAQAHSQAVRDRELTQVLSQDGPVKTRDLERARDKKAEFLSESIKIVINDSFGEPIPGCIFRTARRKLTNEKALMEMIKRSPCPNIEIDYFLDNHGSPLWIQDMLLKALPLPCFYIVVPKIKRSPKDIKDDVHFEGQTVMMVKNVPLKSKDEQTVVDAMTLREWFLCAIVEEDPKIAPFHRAIDETKEVIKQVDKKIKAVAKMEFFEEDGSVMSNKKAEVEREILYKAYGDDRLQLSKRLQQKEEALEKYIEWRRMIGIELTIAEVDVNTETASWYVKIFGVSDAKHIEDLLIKKENWAGINLAAWSKNPPLPPWAGRGPVPDGSQSFIPDYTLLQVNVAGARFMRVAHGVATLRMLDRQSASVAAERFKLFFGQWEGGKKTGHGIEVDDIGVFAGRYLEGLRNGHGRLDLADGTAITGEFGVGLETADNPNEMFENPYKDGEPHGEVDILFADGAFYRGEMHNGRITGKGMYQSAFREVAVGEFKNGLLHGPKGLFTNRVGETFKGDWIFGEINGKGFYENENKDTFAGYFQAGYRHGRGTAVYRSGGRYRGYFCNGMLTGKGELEYGKKSKKTKKLEAEVSLGGGPQRRPKTAGAASGRPATAPAKGTTSSSSQGKTTTSEKVSLSSSSSPGNAAAGSAGGATATGPSDTAKEGKGAKQNNGGAREEHEVKDHALSDYKNCFYGFFLADSVMNGGIVMNTTAQIPASVSRLNKRALIPILAVPQKNFKYLKGLRRLLDKYCDMEIFIRKEITRKKRTIFNQQKLFTKKTMYSEDSSGTLHPTELRGRLLVRKDRLANVKMEKVMPTTALIPRLELQMRVSDQPVEHLSKVFEMIKPDPENGDPRQVRRLVTKVAVSDMEEAQERQRFLKYDLIWKRAEEAFVTRNKA